MTKTGYCPICSNTNHCCNSTDKSLGNCWCTEESFPKAVFDLVPPDHLRKTCICKNCLDQYKLGSKFAI